ncbi:DUF1156 domain-containing protein [Gordonia terrae]
MHKRKLIEVALPLEAINRESAREKAIRHGHPSTLHLWWARRPLAAARAVLFAQLVDDPSSRPDEFPTEDDQRRERERLHNLIERLVVWENTRDEKLLADAHSEILKSTDGNPPPILDPFAGGGAIPVEAQRLGLGAHASDLNPVAVLINKALIELPTAFSGRPPIFPGAAGAEIRTWRGAEGIAADIRAYGDLMHAEADKRLGHMFPLVDGKPGLAWIWARTLTCPNPACGIEMPLVRSWWLGKKKGKESFIVPSVVADADHPSGQRIEYAIGHDGRHAPAGGRDGTVERTGAKCLACQAAVSFDYIRETSRKRSLGQQLMVVVGVGNRQRNYYGADSTQVAAADVAAPDDLPIGELTDWPGRINVFRYGLTRVVDLFTNRQLCVLVTYSDLVDEIRKLVIKDGGTEDYAAAIATYLGMVPSGIANLSSTITSWREQAESPRTTFARQALPMVWDFVESHGIEKARGVVDRIAHAVAALPTGAGEAHQQNAAASVSSGYLISTDPPYYDNIDYSGLSDYFYVWLRRSIRNLYPELLSTMLVPKTEELVANPYRHGGKDKAKAFFETGFGEVFANARTVARDDFPTTVYYAFKQSETDTGGESSSGWETLLEGMIRSGWEITSTWPVRTEGSGRMISVGRNALASSIVLSLRPRPSGAPTTDRRGFIVALQAELPDSLRKLQQGQIAPVDLPQAAIGPGMAVFSRYGNVLEPDGNKMSVRSALARINEMLDQVLNEQEGDFDPVSRFAIAWYRQHGYGKGKFGDADNLARARNTSVDTMDRDEILMSRAGNVQLIKPSELSWDYDVFKDMHTSNWEALHHLIKVLERDGIAPAGDFLRAALSRPDSAIDADLVKELAHLLFRIAEGNGWTKDALSFNALVTSWPEIVEVARNVESTTPDQTSFDFDEGDD